MHAYSFKGAMQYSIYTNEDARKREKHKLYNKNVYIFHLIRKILKSFKHELDKREERNDGHNKFYSSDFLKSKQSNCFQLIR